MSKADYNRSYYEKNKARLKAAAHAYYEANKEHSAEMGRALRARKKAADPVGFRAKGALRVRIWRSAHRETIRARARAAYAANAEQARIKRRAWERANRNQRAARAKQWREENQEKAHAQDRRCWLKAKFGISPEEYDTILAAQRGVCAICKMPEKARAGKLAGKRSTEARALAVDHDHRTGEVRGLLCAACNGALHRIETIDAWAQRAHAYLSRARHLTAVVV